MTDRVEALCTLLSKECSRSLIFDFTSDIPDLSTDLSRAEVERGERGVVMAAGRG